MDQALACELISPLDLHLEKSEVRRRRLKQPKEERSKQYSVQD
jgi:hypothetical protein